MPKLSRKKVEKAIDGCLGNFSTIAERLNVDRSAITHFFKRHPDLREKALEDEEKIKDVVQSHIHVALKNGDNAYIKWFADNKMKDRGYGKTQLDANIQTDVWKDLDNYMKVLDKVTTDETAKTALKEVNKWRKSGDTKD